MPDQGGEQHAGHDPRDGADDAVARPGEDLATGRHPREDQEGGQHRPVPPVGRDQLAEDGRRTGGDGHLNGRLGAGVQPGVCSSSDVSGSGSTASRRFQRVGGDVVNCQVRLDAPDRRPRSRCLPGWTGRRGPRRRPHVCGQPAAGPRMGCAADMIRSDAMRVLRVRVGHGLAGSSDHSMLTSCSMAIWASKTRIARSSLVTFSDCAAS